MINLREIYTAISYFMSSMTVAIMVYFMSSVAVAMPILQIDSTGQLTGAENVNVDGTLYNVEFLDGSCITLFDGCDEQSDFAFNTEIQATLASQALLDTVFIDAGIGKEFNSNSSLTKGCGLFGACLTFTPYLFANQSQILTSFIWNDEIPNRDFIDRASVPINLNTNTEAGQNFAKWNKSLISIPEPNSLYLIIVSLLALLRLKHKKLNN